MTNIERNTVQLFPKNTISRFTVAYQAPKVGESGKWIAGPKKFVLFFNTKFIPRNTNFTVMYTYLSILHYYITPTVFSPSKFPSFQHKIYSKTPLSHYTYQLLLYLIIYITNIISLYQVLP
jgi:hypothetical protein